MRVVSLRTGQILYAANIDGRLREQQRTAKNFTFTDDLERRLRGESLTHVWVDLGLFPGQHVSLDVVDQFGDRNLDLAGITFSAFDPIVGVGAAESPRGNDPGLTDGQRAGLVDDQHGHPRQHLDGAAAFDENAELGRARQS